MEEKICRVSVTGNVEEGFFRVIMENDWVLLVATETRLVTVKY